MELRYPQTGVCLVGRRFGGLLRYGRIPEAPLIGGGERERVDPADGNPLAHARRHIALGEA